HVEQEHTAPKHIGQIRACRSENRPHVLETLRCLRRDVVADELAGCWICRSLTRHEHQPLEPHAWRVRPDGLRKIRCMNRAMCVRHFEPRLLKSNAQIIDTASSSAGRRGQLASARSIVLATVRSSSVLSRRPTSCSPTGKPSVATGNEIAGCPVTL